MSLAELSEVSEKKSFCFVGRCQQSKNVFSGASVVSSEALHRMVYRAKRARNTLTLLQKAKQS